MHKTWISGILKDWSNDIPDGEVYGLIIHSDHTITSTVGRYAHSSGSKSVSWVEFLAGEMNDLVLTTMGDKVLKEAISFITQNFTRNEMS